jgi:hypothetical protein
MREICKSGSMSGDERRSQGETDCGVTPKGATGATVRPQQPRSSSTLPYPPQDPPLI